MKVDSFLAHHGLTENPFAAEEARLDAVFNRLADAGHHHPDLDKIIGAIDQPSTAVVFGEKGSGKTAIRLTLDRRIAAHNAQQNDAHRDRPTAAGKRVLVVPYDDFNPVLDKLTRGRKIDAATVIQNFRLADHQDAILSHAVTRVVDALLDDPSNNDDLMPLPDEKPRQFRKRLTTQQRLDLAVLAGLYDQPPSGITLPRWKKLCKTLRLGWRLPLPFWRNLAGVLTLISGALALGFWWLQHNAQQVTDAAVDAAASAGPAASEVAANAVSAGPDWWMLPLLGLSAAAAIVLWFYWALMFGRTWGLSRKVAKEMPAVGRTPATLRGVFGQLSGPMLAGQPLPQHGTDAQNRRDARYQLTRRFIDILHSLGYAGMVVLVDRVDEPTAVAGDAAKMRSLIWPMFDNKFLKQEGIGIKLLLPIELSYLLNKEGPAFFQEARLDKQNMIERLGWSGVTLYDLCSARLNACASATEDQPLTLMSLFQEGVTRQTLIDALDQMHQPRDAFKFLYSVVQEHCRLLADDAADFKINQLTLDTVRRTQSQRVQELYRGLTPG
ncbi:MAG: hypothetical protein V3V20_03200 [Algisphaera sp.]